MKEFIIALEEITYIKDSVDYEITECPICMESFLNKEILKRVPICHHILHPKCCTTWFESKI